MLIKIGKKQLDALLVSQIRNNFLLSKNEEEDLYNATTKALTKLDVCFQYNLNKYYWNNDNKLIFNPYHSGQYSIFLYYLSKEIWLAGNDSLADKVYYLNKMLNCCDLFYQVDLPEIFHLDHPLGSIMGRGTYKNYFIFQQNCTVGNNNGIFPIFGEFVWLFANTTVIGNSIIGDNVFISAGTFVKDENIPNNSIVFGASPNLIIKEKNCDYFYKKSPFKCHREMV